jgi:hypothetical protein
MKKFLMKAMILAALAAIGHMMCKKFCCRENCGCKKEA